MSSAPPAGGDSCLHFSSASKKNKKTILVDLRAFRESAGVIRCGTASALAFPTCAHVTV